MEELAPAKINLNLRVLRRRNDGFHEIETLMAPLTLRDSLQLEPADNFSFRCNDASLPGGEGNLVVRAARLFFSETKIAPRVSITLQKNIPHGAGLGGGSSDAAATLRALDKFFITDLLDDQLRNVAARLGSDVPFFLQSRTAICRGRGEIVEQAKLPHRFRIVLLKPQFSVSTAWAYSRWSQSRQLSEARYTPQAFGGIDFVNDLERPVFEKFVYLAQLKTWLSQRAQVALLSGSGSTVFAVVEDDSCADTLIQSAHAEFDPHLWACKCETLA